MMVEPRRPVPTCARRTLSSMTSLRHRIIRHDDDGYSWLTLIKEKQGGHVKSKGIKAPISKKATRNPKAAGAEPAKEVESLKSRGEVAAARRNEKIAGIAGQKRVRGHQMESTRRNQGKRDVKND
jgi:hypothetical protein